MNKNSIRSWKELAFLLKKGEIVVMPTDTIYGICGSALNKKTVEKIYKLRKRNLKKPVIVLIERINDLKIFGIDIKKFGKNILNKFQLRKTSIILDCKEKKFKYLHRGGKTIAFRIPKNKFLLKILKISGPIVAPSANHEGQPPSTTIKEAMQYFGNKVFYYDAGKIKSKPSKVIEFKDGKITVVRK